MKRYDAARGITGRGLILGPGTVAAIILVTALTLSGRIPLVPSQKKPEAKQLQLTPEQELGPTPEPAYVTARADALHLTKQQRAELRRLADQYQAVAAPLRWEIAKASDSLGGYLQDKREKGLPAGPIDTEAARQYSLLSGQLSDLRAEYWNKALAALTDAQKVTLSQLRRIDFARKTHPRPDSENDK